MAFEFDFKAEGLEARISGTVIPYSEGEVEFEGYFYKPESEEKFAKLVEVCEIPKELLGAFYKELRQAFFEDQEAY